jgi:hypothetical protein
MFELLYIPKVAELEQRVAEHAALLSIAEAKVAEAQPAAEAAWEKVGGGGDNTLDDIMDDYEEGMYKNKMKSNEREWSAINHGVGPKR